MKYYLWTMTGIGCWAGVWGFVNLILDHMRRSAFVLSPGTVPRNSEPALFLVGALSFTTVVCFQIIDKKLQQMSEGEKRR